MFGSVRKQADADCLQLNLGPSLILLLLDVTNESAVRAVATQVRPTLILSGWCPPYWNISCQLSMPAQTGPHKLRTVTSAACEKACDESFKDNI